MRGQLSYLVGDDGKAAPGAACARSFDLGVQGQEIGLLGDGSNNLDERREGANPGRQVLYTREVGTHLFTLAVKLHFDCDDHLLVIFSALMGTLGQVPSA